VKPELKRSFVEIADATLNCADRLSSGVGCSRNERGLLRHALEVGRVGGYDS